MSISENDQKTILLNVGLERADIILSHVKQAKEHEKMKKPLTETGIKEMTESKRKFHRIFIEFSS